MMSEKLKNIFEPSEKVQKMYEAISLLVQEKKDISTLKVQDYFPCRYRERNCLRVFFVKGRNYCSCKFLALLSAEQRDGEGTGTV